MNQIRADLHRFAARRLVRWSVIVIVAIAVVSMGIATLNGKPAHETTQTYYGPPPEFVPGPGPVTFPQGEVEMVPQTYTRMTDDSRLKPGRDLDDLLGGTGIVVVLLGIILGASFVGAEFGGASLSTQLLFQPNRTRTHLSKATAVAIGVFDASLIISLTVAVTMVAGAAINGVLDGVDTSWAIARFGDMARVGLAGAAAALMAYAVALATRRTGAAIMFFVLQFPFILIVRPDNEPFGPLSKYAPLRGLLAVANNFPEGTSGDLTKSTAITLVVVSLAVFLVLSDRLFARAEVR